MKTSTPKHTPGPWKIADVRSTSISIETVAQQHVKSMDAITGRDLSGQRSELVARAMSGASLAPGVGEANAALIAAAPDLLTALKEVSEASQFLVTDGAGTDRCTSEFRVAEVERLTRAYWASIEKARAAIAKAEGR